jgi:tetrahydromethanopterin S-methyltransferase subunit F
MTSGRFSGLAVGLVSEGWIVVLRDEGFGGLG